MSPPNRRKSPAEGVEIQQAPKRPARPEPPRARFDPGADSRRAPRIQARDNNATRGPSMTQRNGGPSTIPLRHRRTTIPQRHSRAERGQDEPRRTPNNPADNERTHAKLELGQVGFLEVTDLVPFGAFVDWGLPKELLVPFAEQLCEMRKGDRYAIGVIKDDQGRFTGTQRIAAMLHALPPFKVNDWVDGEAWRKEPKLGVFVIVEKQYLGLVPESEPHELQRGTAAKFRVSQVLIDGKIQLSLRRKAYEEMPDDAERVLTRLEQGCIPVGDATDPETIRLLFGMSKKAFKRAVGRLFKQGALSLDAQGCVVVVKKTQD